MKRTVRVGVFGATSGFTMEEYGPNGAKQVIDASIPWESGPDGAMFWPKQWLEHIILAAEGYSKKDDAFVLAMPGADLAWIESGIRQPPERLPLAHYRGVKPEHLAQFLEMVGMTAEEVYMATGGAMVEFFQPYAQIAAMMERIPNALAETKAIVPLADLLTYCMTGVRGLDQGNLQSQGLWLEGSGDIYTRLLGASARVVAPWKHHPENAYYKVGGIHYIPTTHDSILARMIGLIETAWVIWTGSWIGTATAIGEDVHPSPETFAAKLAFEGVGEKRAAASNVGMYGQVYKELVVVRGKMSYQEASRQAKGLIDGVETVDLGPMPDETKAAADWLLEKNRGFIASAAVCLVKSAAKACFDRMLAVSQVLGMPMPEQVALVGGWSQNLAFISSLERLGLKVIVPRFANNSTHAAAAAEALVRIGDAPDFRSALAMLPERN